MYNTVSALVACEKCGGKLEVQITYGNLYSHDYRVGDTLVWGRPEVGVREEKKVWVKGDARCVACDNNDQEFDVLICDNVIKEVVPSDGIREYPQEGYIVCGEESE